MKEHKTDMNMTEKLSSSFTTEHKTDMKNTKNWTALLWRSTKQTRTLLILRNTKKLNMMEHKTDMNIPKIEKIQKLIMTEH